MHLFGQFTLLSICASLFTVKPDLERPLPIRKSVARNVPEELVAVRINVFDEKGPLSGVVVSSADGIQSITTDAAGNCQLNSPSGTTLLVAASQHKTYRLIVPARGAVNYSLKIRQLDGSEIVTAAPLIHLSGVVLTQEGKPMSGADVAVSGRQWVTKTDQAGHYEIDVPQNSLLSVSKFGYEPKSVVVLTTTTVFSPKMALREGIDPSILTPDTKSAKATLPQAPANYKLAAGEVITEADENPTYPGGADNLETYLATNVRYPEEARQSSVAGTVLVSFIVDTDGSISRIRVLKGLNHGTDEEAVRVVARMPNWTPGKQKGRAVPVLCTLPVAFSPEK